MAYTRWSIDNKRWYIFHISSVPGHQSKHKGGEPQWLAVMPAFKANDVNPAQYFNDREIKKDFEGVLNKILILQEPNHPEDEKIVRRCMTQFMLDIKEKE